MAADKEISEDAARAIESNVIGCLSKGILLALHQLDAVEIWGVR